MFPLDSIDMDKFIFDNENQDFEEYIYTIKKLLSQNNNTYETTIFETKVLKNDSLEEDDINYEIEKKNNTYLMSNNSSDEEYSKSDLF